MPLYKWGIYIRPPLKSMIAKNITLLGDAAHPMVPFLGQGACMAIEDAYSFAMACKEKIANLRLRKRPMILLEANVLKKYKDSQ